MKLRLRPTTLSLLRERVGGGGAAKGNDPTRGRLAVAGTRTPCATAAVDLVLVRRLGSLEPNNPPAGISQARLKRPTKGVTDSRIFYFASPMSEPGRSARSHL
jgi:hypothetical protein